MGFKLDDPTKTWPWQGRLALYLAGMIVSGVVAVLIKNYFDKGSLEVVPTSIAVFEPSADSLASSPPSSGGHESYTPNSTLVSDADASTWFIAHEASFSITEYTKWLLETRDEAAVLADEIPRLRIRMADWPEVINEDTVKTVFGILHEFSSLIMAHIFGEVRAGRELFSGNPPSTESMEPHLRIDDDKDGDFYVSHNFRRLPIFWSIYAFGTQERADCKAAAQRIVNAVAYGFALDLAAIKTEIERIYQEQALIDRILSTGQQELRAHSRWSVTATITNTGNRAVSMDPRVALYADCGTVTIQRNSAPFTFPKDVKLDMQRVVTDHTTQFSNEPLVIQGGASTSVTFWSLDRISEIENGHELLELFNQQGCECTLRYLPLTPALPVWQAESNATDPYSFRAISINSLYPEPEPEREPEEEE